MGRRSRWRVDRIAHPAVPLWLAHDDDDDALVWVAFADRARSSLAALARRGPSEIVVERGRTSARVQLLEYLAGTRRRFELPLRPIGTAFQCRAWDALTKIPYGRTRSYGQQAAAIDRPSAVRAVGRANGANPLPIVVPCHRVVGGDGTMTGFGGGIAVKRWLLELERRGSPPAWSPATSAGDPQLELF